MASSVPPPVFFHWDPNMTHSTHPETPIIVHMATQPGPASNCSPHLGLPSTDILNLGSGLSEPRLPRPLPAPRQNSLRVRVFLTRPCAPTASTMPCTDEAPPAEAWPRQPGSLLSPQPISPYAQQRQRWKMSPAPSPFCSPYTLRKAQEAMGVPSSGLATSGERAWYILLASQGPAATESHVTGLMSLSPEVRVLLTHPPMNAYHDHNNKTITADGIH